MDKRKRIDDLGRDWRHGQAPWVPSHALLRAGIARLRRDEPGTDIALEDFWQAFGANGFTDHKIAATATKRTTYDLETWIVLTALYTAADPQRITSVTARARGRIFDVLEYNFPWQEPGGSDGSDGGPTPAPTAA